MSEMDVDLPENDLPSAFSMWKMFHRTITVVFKNLDNAENNLQTLANTILNSKEFSDIFVPRFDSTQNYSENQLMENKYKAFTTWLLGRLFFLLSCEKFERIHTLFIQAQLQILDILRLNQPKVYNSMVAEYNSALTLINNKLSPNQKAFEIIQLLNFIPDESAINKSDLDLSPKFVELNSENSCFALQQKLLAILSKIAVGYTDSFWLDELSISIINNLIDSLEFSRIRSKIIVLEFFVEIVEKNWFQIKNATILQNYCRQILGYLSKFVVASLLILNQNESNDFFKVFKQLLEVIQKYEIYVFDKYVNEKSKYLADFLILQQLQQFDLMPKSVVETGAKLMRNILEFDNCEYKNMNQVTNYVLGQKNLGFAQILIEYHILKELKHEAKQNSDNYSYDLLAISKTWRLYFDVLNLKLDNLATTREIEDLPIYLNFMKQLMETAQNVYLNFYNWFYNQKSQKTYTRFQLNFFKFDQIILKLLNIIKIYDIHATHQSLDDIIESISAILTFTTISKEHLPQYSKIIDLICYPFTREEKLKQYTKYTGSPNLDGLGQDTCLEKQLKSIDFLSICLMNIDHSDQQSFTSIKNNILNIMKFYSESNNTDILQQVAKSILNLCTTLKNSFALIYHMLIQLLSSNNNEVLKVLSENLGLIICILSGNYIIYPAKVNEQFKYEFYCLQCDFTKQELGETNERKLCRKCDNSCCFYAQFVIQKNFVAQGNFAMILLLFDAKDVYIKRNIVTQLPRILRHIAKFHTNDITAKWLNFMVDDDREVRINLANVIQILVDNSQNNESLSKDNKKNILDTCLKSLREIAQKHVRSQNTQLLETLLETIKQFGCLSYPEVVFTSTKLLIYFLILCNTYLSLTAIDHLKHIAKSHHVTPNQLYIKYKKNFCRTLVEMSVYSYCSLECTVIQSLDRMSLAFGFTTKDFITRDGHYLLPHFLPMFVKIPESRNILNEIASLVIAEPSELLISNFSYIYTHIYLHEPENVFKKCIQYIEVVTKCSVPVLKKRSIKVIHNELLMHFHDKRELVLRELHNLSREESELTPESNSNKREINMQQISDYLQPRFLGVLVYFDSKLVSKSVGESVKIRVLQNLPEIIKLMGTKYITPLRFKVLATLRTALSLTDQPYLELICLNWEAFVHCCEVDSLGPILSTIFVSILPLNALFPRKVNAIFKYLIIENEEKLKDYIQDLYFLLESNTNAELKNVIKKHCNANRSETFKDELLKFLKYIDHENLEVRVYGLKYLKKYLENKHSELEDHVFGDKCMDSVLVELIDVLMTGCRESNEAVRLACGNCLGELGAIEPSHFPRKYTQADSDFIFYLTDDSFAVNALMELLRSFQMEKHTQNMNRFALAIQEILKAYGVSPDESAPKHNLWTSFPENMKELMLPLLSSRYTIAVQSEKITIHPICGSYMGSTFNDWIYNWTSYLISILTNEKRSLLQVCKPSLKHDYRTIMFFLPHIVIHSLLECTEAERKLIYDEFLAVLNMSNTGKKLNPEHLKYRALKTNSYISSNTMKKSEDSNKNNYIKVIFVLLDYLDRWLQEFQVTKCPKSKNPMSEIHYQTIHNFLSGFCKLKIAECNFVRGEYPRALMYLEQYVSRDKIKLNEQLGFFARIYAELEEPDGVAGAMAIRVTEPSLEDMILAHNVSGQLQDAAACYERMAQECTFKPQYLREMVRCYLELDNPYTAFNIANGAMDTYPEYKTMLIESQAEPFWRLSSYNELSNLLIKPEMKYNSSWGVTMGQALVYFRNGKRLEFQEQLSKMRKMLVDMLSITSLEEGVFRHGYPHIIKLHILNELEKAEATVYKIMQHHEDKLQCEKSVNDLIDEWDIRLNIVQSSVRVVEPILRLRRIILEQSQYVLGSQANNVKATMNKHIAKYWLKSAEIARKACIFQQAYIYILKAEHFKPMELFVEKAQLYWAKEEQELAFSTLKRGVEEHFSDALTFKDMDSSLRKSDRKLCAEAKLLIAKYNDETSNVDMDMNISNYREAVDMYREWENSQVCLAQYYDRVLSTMTDEDKDIQGGDIQVHIINCFGKSLQYGSKYIYQSMPRMLSIWFDYGTRIIASKPTDDAVNRDTKKNTLFKMIKLMDTYLDRLPAYMFLSAFSQLVSRICHPVREVYIQIKAILIKLILKYPQQSMWMILAVSKSAYAMRTKRCQEMLQDQRLKSSKVIKLVYDFNRLAEKLIELCNKPINDGVLTTSVNTLIRSLPRLLQSKEFSEIILPIQKLRKVVLPNSDYSNNQYDPFPNKYVYIVGIEDEISVLQSLQRPRKIIFRGSDGQKYIHMLKPKDDLRKDSRLMEFNDVVNLYLHREAESRQRRLCIRTYSVVPLNEECGIVEWVDNLVGLRPILMKIYKQKGIFVSSRELKNMMCNARDPLARKRQLYEEKLLPKHPPVLAEWFRRTFPDASFWHQARTAYIRTSAVISMVGYMLGLGDRHGENISFDSTNGDTVHVDFNCLFNKGESFDWPERVPFRLTHNMVDAMGPMGVDGIFRKTCAVTLRVLRIHTDTLMSIVRPFVYDPLVSWPRNQLLKSEQSEAERTNEQAVEHIRNIESRLKGMIKTRGNSFSISLSCEGQANNLILEATNIDNLSQMYIGWGPFL